jgi:hypothetical protein
MKKSIERPDAASRGASPGRPSSCALVRAYEGAITYWPSLIVYT